MLAIMTYLALKIPGPGGDETVKAPGNIPTGGLQEGDKGSLAIQNSITILLITITILSLFFLIFGGIKWIMSQGEKTKIDSARKTITYAIIGLILAFLSFFIIRVVGSIFGVDLI